MPGSRRSTAENPSSATEIALTFPGGGQQHRSGAQTRERVLRHPLLFTTGPLERPAPRHGGRARILDSQTDRIPIHLGYIDAFEYDGTGSLRPSDNEPLRG